MSLSMERADRFLFGPPPIPTPSELNVLELVALGLSTPDIAKHLHVSRQAVTYHIGNLLSKFQIENRAGLVARAYVCGILDAASWPPVANSQRNSA